MGNKSYVLGVDGGGTKTVAYLAEVSNIAGKPFVGQIVGRGSAGPGNPKSAGIETAYQNILSAISCAQQESGLPFLENQITAVCVCLAGAGRAQDQIEIEAYLKDKVAADSILVTGDIEPIQWAAKFEQEVVAADSNYATSPGEDTWSRCVTLIAGTGSIARGVMPGCDPVRAGGWGYLLGDEGSGFYIAQTALKNLCRLADRDVRLTSMHQALLDQIQIKKVQDLVGFVYQSQRPQQLIASLANVVLRFADSDSEAQSIVTHTINAWADLIGSVLHQMRICDNYALAISGGIAVHHPAMVGRLLSSLEQRGIAPLTCKVVEHPVHGALVMAAKSISKC